MSEISNIHFPNPGSDDGIAAGCTCPVYDNAHGRGYMGIEGVFIYLEGCPVHSANIKVSGIRQRTATKNRGKTQ